MRNKHDQKFKISSIKNQYEKVSFVFLKFFVVVIRITFTDFLSSILNAILIIEINIVLF